MAYTPELSQAGSATLRRMAWASGQPMTKTIEQAISELTKIIDKNLVCSACRDPKCELCYFSERG